MRRQLHISLSNLLFLLSAVFLLLCCKNRETEPLTVATAANMQFAMKELLADFSNTNGIPTRMITGSSGKLTAQILEGAPYDLFVSADMEYPEKVFQEGKAVTPPQIYAYGKLVLWSMSAINGSLTDSLLQPRFRKIAVANPTTAPYGRAAMEVLEKRGLKDSLKDRLVYGESIAQVNQFIISGASQAGFTAMSAVRSEQAKDKGVWEAIPETDYSPIAQGIIILNRREEMQEVASQFKDYLYTEKALKILEEFGYSRDE